MQNNKKNSSPAKLPRSSLHFLPLFPPTLHPVCVQSPNHSFLPHLRPSLSSLIKEMKLIKIGSFFSKLSKSKKRGRIESPSFGSVATTSYSSEGNITPKSVLPVAVDDLFSVFDRDGDGKISKRELEAVLRRLGPHDPPTEEELASMVAEIDRDGDGCISLDELGAIGPAALEEPAAGDELRDAFSVFDADGDGKISAEELLGVFIAIGDGECTIDDCRRMIVGVDTDGDGFVCFGDFERMMDGKR